MKRLVRIAARTVAGVVLAVAVWNFADSRRLEWDQSRPEGWRS